MGAAWCPRGRRGSSASAGRNAALNGLVALPAEFGGKLRGAMRIDHDKPAEGPKRNERQAAGWVRCVDTR